MMAPHRYSVPSLLVRIFITLVITLVGQAHAKFLKADLRWPGFLKAHNDLQPSLTDILAFREPDEDPIFEKAMHVVDTLATQSTCHQAAAAQLLITCKAVGANIAKEDGKHELLERAKSVYAVRVAVCETGEGRAEVPSACKSVLEIPQRLEHEIDVVNSRTLAPCLGALMVEHYYWTSYSNNRQDGNTLCQATTLESTRLEALHSYQTLAKLLPEFRTALGSTRSQWMDFLKQQEEDVQHLSKLQRRNREELQSQHKVELSSFREAMIMAKSGLLDVSLSLQQAMASTDSDITQTREALGHVLADFANLQDLLQEASTRTSEKNAEVAAAQARDIMNVHELALAATRALENIHADAVVQDVNALVYQLKTDLDQIATAQSTQLESTQHHLQLSEELSTAQKASLALGERMKHSSTSLASELDAASAVAGRVSTKLDRVNQALTRVEAASAVLSSLFAIITIPCRVAEHLHLRLMGLFAMPAFVLSFWKPRRYSYSFIALYVFLESLISFAGEHHEKVSEFLWRLGHHSRAISTSGLGVFRSNLAVAAAATIIICCCYLLATTSAKPKPKTLTLKSVEEFDDLTKAERYYMERRLRNGKRLRHSADRFRRAATVC